MSGKVTRGRKRMHHSERHDEKYVAPERTAEDRREWQKLQRTGSHAPAS